MIDLDDARGFTFWRGWAEAIVWPVPQCARALNRKDIDNRPYAPPRSRVGKLFAVHTGQKVDHDGLAWMAEAYGYDWTADDLAEPGVILGVVRLAGLAEGQPPWHFGPTRHGRPNFGWRLDSLIAFDEPLPCKPRCAQGWWRVPPDVLPALRVRCGLPAEATPRPPPAARPPSPQLSLGWR